MIHLHFDGPLRAQAVTLGPAPWFRIAGNYIRQGPHNVIVGSYRRHQWEVQAKYFTRYDCRDRAVIHFEDVAGGPTENFGPFPCFHGADGVVYAADKLFAKFIEESQLWHCYPTETFWPVMVVQAAPPP
jgi:hypothetical protein